MTHLYKPDSAGPHPIPYSTAWSDASPKGPGWFWYEDEYYGPAPIYLDWIGFPSNLDARTLVVDMCMGEDQELISTHIGDLHGRWFPLAEPPKQ